MPNQEDFAKHWKEQIKRAEKAKKSWREKYRVEDCYKYYLGDQRPENYVEEDWFTLNLVFSNARAQIPSLYFKDPYFFVRVKRSFTPDLQIAQQMDANMSVREGVLNYLGKENGLVTIGQLCILDAYMQFAVIKARYVPDFEINPDAGKPKNGENGEVLTDETGVELREPESNLVGEKFVWERVNPNNFLVDGNSGCEQTAWVAQKSWDYLEKVRKNPKFSNTGKDNLEADALVSDFDEDNSKKTDGFIAKLGGRSAPRKFKDAKESEKIVTYYEIYDMSRNKIIVIAEKGKKPLLEMDTPPGIEGHPFSFLRFNSNPGEMGEESWYPIPEAFNQLGPQKEYNLACNDVAIHRKRYKRKYGYYEGDLDDEEIDKFEDPVDGGMIRFNQPNWQGSFAPIQDAALDSAVMFDRIHLRMDFDDIAGSTPNQVGAAKSDTATEAEILERRLQIRESDKQFLIRRFLVDTARKMHQLLESNLTTEGAVRVVGPRGENWIPYGPQDFDRIPAEIEFDIDVASMSPRNNMVERAQWMQFITTVLQAPQVFGDPDVLKWWAEKFDIREEEKLMKLSQALQQFAQTQMMQGGASNVGGGNAPSSMGNIFSGMGGAGG